MMKNQTSSGKVQPHHVFSFSCGCYAKNRFSAVQIYRRKELCLMHYVRYAMKQMKPLSILSMAVASLRSYWAAFGVAMPSGQDLSELHKLDWPNSIPQQCFETLVALACWQLWKRRNAVIFRNERLHCINFLL